MSEPAVTLPCAHSSAGTNAPVTRVVVHTAECDCVPGAEVGVAHYGQTQAAGGSWHYCVGPDGEQHNLPDTTIAWHAPPNGGSIGVELTGRADVTDWGTGPGLQTLSRAATRVAELCHRHGVPAVRIGVAELLAGAHGICGHRDVSQAWHQSDHTDPGASFPWDRLMVMISAATALIEHDNAPAAPAAPTAHSALLPPRQRPVLQVGSTGGYVGWLQRRLGMGSPNSTFDSKTNQWVCDFQRKHGLPADGVVGPDTWAAIG